MVSELSSFRTIEGWSPEQFARGQSAILRQVAQGAPLGDVLDALARLIESLHPGILCSVLLLTEDGRHLVHGAAPSLPSDYSHGIDGAEIGPTAGSCGTAAFFGSTVIAADIASDPRWELYRHLALPHGLRACWSCPVLGRDGTVLGTFAVYHREPHEPTATELALVREATDLARMAMEQARDAEALRRSEERYRTLVSATSQAVWVYRADGSLVAPLSTWAAFTGTTVEDIKAGGWLRSIHPDDRERTKAAWVRALATRTAYEIEHRVRRADGEWRTMIGHAVPIFGPNGEVREWIGTHRDVTQHRRSEAARRESEATLALALEAAAMGSWTWASPRIGSPCLPDCRPASGRPPREIPSPSGRSSRRCIPMTGSESRRPCASRSPTRRHSRPSSGSGAPRHRIAGSRSGARRSAVATGARLTSPASRWMSPSGNDATKRRAPSKRKCSRRRNSRASESWRVASRTTSTICWWGSWVTPGSH